MCTSMSCEVQLLKETDGCMSHEVEHVLEDSLMIHSTCDQVETDEGWDGHKLREGHLRKRQVYRSRRARRTA